MGWFDSLFGDDTGEMVNADGDRPDAGRAGDPFGRILPAPVFDAFREAWKAGAGLLDLFGKEPVKIKEPVGPDSPNRRPDVAKVETFLDRTGYLDLAKTEGPTGYYGSRVDQGILRFQKQNALKVDGLINPDGETLQTLGALLSEGEQPSLQATGFSPIVRPIFAQTGAPPERPRPLYTQATASVQARVADWLGRRKPAAPDLPARLARHDTLTPRDKSASLEQVSAREGDDTSKAAEPSHLTPPLDKIERTYRNRVEGLRRRGMPLAAANLEHFLNGTGEPRKLPRDEAIKLEPIKDAEATNNERFVNGTFRGISEDNNEVKKLPYLREGEKPFEFEDEWDRDFNYGNYLWNAAVADRDFAAAIGRAKFKSKGSFAAVRKGDVITISGTVTHSLHDDYDFHRWQPGAEGALALQDSRSAKPFAFGTEWKQQLTAVIPVKEGRLGKPKVTWGKISE